MLATVALFLTTPYVGYLDNITVLFLLSLMIPFVHEARTSWGARTALFLIGIAAAFTHPTTCVIFGVVLMAVFGFHFLTSRFSFGAALKADAPMLMSVGFGMIAGLCLLGDRDLGEAVEPRRSGPAPAVHREVLRGPALRMDRVAAADRDRARSSSIAIVSTILLVASTRASRRGPRIRSRSGGCWRSPARPPS